MEYYIGIDIGTYESKGVLIDDNGIIVKEVTRGHELIIPNSGWAEHDAEKTWWGDIDFILSEIKNHNEENQIVIDSIKNITISSIAPSVVPIDASGNPLRNAILYGIDTRTIKQIDFLNQQIGIEKISEIGKQQLTTQAGGPKILWIKENEPEIYNKTKLFLSGAAFIGFKLTNKAGMDHYTAASFAPLYDFEQQSWSEEIVPFITEMGKLPTLNWATEELGSLTPKMAQKFGLSSNTKVLFGTTDALAEAISCGLVEKGDLMLMYGSSTFFILNTEKLAATTQMWPNLHVQENLYSLTGGTSTAGSLTRWYIDLFVDRKEQTATTFQDFSELANLSCEGANGIICLPHFSGERTPINNPQAKGLFFGLSLKHTKGDLYRAILEGVAYSIRQNIEYIKSLGFEIQRIVCIGGGTKNKLWLQIVSDICGIEQIVTHNKVGAAYGDAFLGWKYNHYNADLLEIKNWLKVEETIIPNTNLKQIYDAGYQKYLMLYKQLENLM